MYRSSLFVFFFFISHLLFLSGLFAADPAEEIFSAYQLNNVDKSVSYIFHGELNDILKDKVEDAIIDSCLDAATGEDNFLSERDKKEEIRKRIKDKIKKYLPLISKELLYKRLFLPRFGDEINKATKFTDEIIEELNVSINERIDNIVAAQYDSAINSVEDYISGNIGPLHGDLRDIKKTIKNTIDINNVAWGMSKAVTELMGEAVEKALKKRFKDILSGDLPPEVISYLDYGPDRIDEFLNRLKSEIPFDQIENYGDQILHTPLFVLPNNVYCGLLAASASYHFTAAFKGPVVDTYELKRGVEVTRVMIWQYKNKDGLSIDLSSFLKAADFIYERFGISVDKFGKFGMNLNKINTNFYKLEDFLSELESEMDKGIKIISSNVRSLVEKTKDELEKFQNELFSPLTSRVREVEQFVANMGENVADHLPEKFNGIPRDWKAFREQFGLNHGVINDIGELSPWKIIQRFIDESGLRKKFEALKEDFRNLGEEVNDRVSDEIAGVVTEAIDRFGFTDRVSRMLSIEKVPAENTSKDNPLDPVLLHNGEFIYNMTDLFIPGRGVNYAFRRIYRSRVNFRGSLGHNWSHNLERFLIINQDCIDYVDGEGRNFTFKKQNGKFRSVRNRDIYLKRKGDSYIVKGRDNLKYFFNKNGVLKRIEDEYRNGLVLQYDRFGRLDKVIDSVDRVISYFYDKKRGFLIRVEDFAGRSIKFSYNRYGDLTSVTGPETFDYPEGKTVRYAYSTGFHKEPLLNHNLIIIMDPNGNIYLKNKYDQKGLNKDKVTAQFYGSGKKMNIDYKILHPGFIWKFVSGKWNRPVDQVEVTDRRSVKYIYKHNVYGNLVEKRVMGWDESVKRDEKWSYDDKGLVVSKKFINGALITYEYKNDDARPDIEKLISPDGDVREKKYLYDENSGRLRRYVDPEGNIYKWDFGCRRLRKNFLDVGWVQKSCNDTFFKHSVCEKSKCTDVYEKIYDKYGDLKRSINETGVVTDYEYDDEGNLVSYTLDVEGVGLKPTWTFDYDSVGNIIGALNPAGEYKSYLVNSLNQIVEEHSGKGGDSKKYVFDKNDNLIEIIVENRGGYNLDEIGRELRYRYKFDEMDRLVELEEPISKNRFIKTVYNYDDQGHLVKEIFSEGNDIEYTYDELGRVVYVKKGEEKVEFVYGKWSLPPEIKKNGRLYRSFGFNGFGEILSVDDSIGNTLELERDKLGRITEEKFFNRRSELLFHNKYLYNWRNQIIEKRSLLFKDNPKNGKWVSFKLKYDASGRMTSYEIDGKPQIDYRYDDLGNVISKIYFGHKREDYSYDRMGRITGVSLKSGHSKNYQYKYVRDTYGNIERVVFSDKKIVKLTYDTRLNLIKIADGKGERRFLYDGIGRRTEVKEKMNDSSWRSIKYRWDGNGRLKELIFPNGGSVQYNYDRTDRISEVIYPGKREVKYSYNGGVRPHIIRKNDSSVYQYFDSEGRLIFRRFRSPKKMIGTTAQYFYYDGLGRLKYSFDNNDSETEVDDSSVYYFYDSFSNIVGEVQGEKEFIKTVGSDGRSLSEIYPSGMQVFRSYEDDHLDTIFLNSDRIRSYYFNEQGEINSYFDDNGMNVIYKNSYPSKEIQYRSSSGEIVQKDSYFFNSNGKLFKFISGEKEYNYGYDNVGRLNLFSSDNNHFYIYDKNDLLTSTRHGDEINVVSREYDKDGNIDSLDDLDFHYDGLGRLSLITNSGGDKVAEYGYDVHNRRVIKRVEGGVKKYFYDGWNEIEEYSDDKILRSFVYGDGLDTLVMYIDHLSGKKYYYHLNHSGSVHYISDSSGQITKSYDYLPYGKISSKTDVSQPYLFSGRRFDLESDLYYFRNRYYSPKLRAFLTPDPLGYKAINKTKTESIVPFHISFHRRGNVNLFPNNLHWTSKKGSPAITGISRFNMWNFRGKRADRVGEANLYRYAYSDPVNAKDPLGLDYLWITGEYKNYPGGSGRYADLKVLWVEESANGDHLKGNVIPTVYHSVSGPWGRGALPSGDYRGYFLRQRFKKGMVLSGFGWSLNIDPIFPTNRSLLRIHPDGNSFGSLGCGAIDKNGYISLYNRLSQYLKEEGNSEIDVHVRIRGDNRMNLLDPREDTLIRSHADFVSTIPYLH